MRNRHFSTLKQRRDFLRLTASPLKAAVPGLVLQIAPQPPDLEPGSRRVGFTASRKIGNAVKRNRAKRRLRAAATEVIGAHGHFGHDYVLIARATTVTSDWFSLLRDLRNAMRRAGAWRD